MKKVILTKTNTKQATCAAKVTSPDSTKSKLAYAELFRAVLKIPEKDVQHRILDAVNGWPSTAQIVHALCPNCKQTFGNSTYNREEVATQTDVNEKISHSLNSTIKLEKLESTQSELNSNTNSDDSQDRRSPALQKSIISSTMTPNAASAPVNQSTQAQQLSISNEQTGTLLVPLKRKRKRKVCLPQVVKRSHAQIAQTQLQPKLKSRKVETVCFC